MMTSRRVPFIPQNEAADCGATALAMALAYRGVHVPLRELRLLTDTGRDGVSVRALVKAAAAVGVPATARRLSDAQLFQASAGSIACTRDHHFVVLDRRVRGGRRVIDPSVGPRVIADAELSQLLAGVVIVLDRSVAPARRPRELTARGVASQMLTPHRSLIAACILLSLFAQTALFATPAVIALALRPEKLGWLRAHPAASSGLAGACLMAVAGLFVARSRSLSALRVRVDETITSLFVRRLVSLPMSYFHQRSTAHFLTQINGSAAMRDAFNGATVSGLIDGSSALVLLTALSQLSGAMTAMACLGAVLIVVVAWRTLTTYETSAAELQTARGQTQSDLVTIMFGIEQVKAQGLEQEVLGAWSDHYASESRAVRRTERLAQRVQLTGDVLRAAGPALALLVALGTSAGPLSTLIPAAALMGGALFPVANLCNNLMALASARAHALRMLDVLTEPPDPALDLPAVAWTGAPAVSCKDAGFRYVGARSQTLAGVTFDLLPGHVAVVTGPSGCGKTTLLKPGSTDDLGG